MTRISKRIKGLVFGACVLAGSVGVSADWYNCYHNGTCQWQAECEGDWAWEAPCNTQCWVWEESCPPLGTGCYVIAGNADCGNPVG